MENLNKFLKQTKKARTELKYSRKNFWKKNKTNFKNNLKTLLSFFKFPEGWKVNIIASYFLIDNDKKIMPYDYDYDIWSFVDVVGANEKQGFEIVVFFNRHELEFLSAPALVPLIVHELKHVDQASRDPKKYLETGLNNQLNKEFEQEAEAEVQKYSDEFRKQNVLEKVLYCYDKKSWLGAKKMAQYMHDQTEVYGGGYNQEMTDKEYEIFLKSEDEKDIDIFIDYFIDSVKEEKEEEQINEIILEKSQDDLKKNILIQAV